MRGRSFCGRGVRREFQRCIRCADDDAGMVLVVRDRVCHDDHSRPKNADVVRGRRRGGICLAHDPSAAGRRCRDARARHRCARRSLRFAGPDRPRSGGRRRRTRHGERHVDARERRHAGHGFAPHHVVLRSRCRLGRVRRRAGPAGGHRRRNVGPRRRHRPIADRRRRTPLRARVGYALLEVERNAKSEISTSSAWPGRETFCHALRMTPAASATNVDR